ncbi:MAG: hypothetical protein AAGG02_05160 [Cyanobacteria bacterium P01_H01_bin.15]
MTTQSDSAVQPASEELLEIIGELEKYRERLVSDTLGMAQKAKIVKAKALANLEPQLAKIDAQLAHLRQQAGIETPES